MLIPLRALARRARPGWSLRGEAELPDLAEVAETVELCANLAPERILLDTWDLAKFATPGTGPPALLRLLRFAAGDKP